MTDESLLKFSGVFTLQDTEKDESHPIQVQVLFSDGHHVIVIYQFSDDKLEWLQALITGVIENFQLDPNTTVAMACSCEILGSGEVEPENGVSWGITFSWEDNKAVIGEVRKFESEKE